MAQHNIGHFYGRVCSEPLITRNEKGEPVNVNLFVQTCVSGRRYLYANEDKELRFEQIMLASGVRDTVEVMAELHMNDIIIFKGTINTRNVEKMAKCKNPDCAHFGERFNVNGEPGPGREFTTGMITFVTPIAIDIRNTELTEEEAMEILVDNREMSNEVMLIGNLCGDPQSWEGGNACSYQIGVNRNFYLKDDDPSVSSDYPYIRTYGQQAASDMETLMETSCVLIDGFAHMRKVRRSTECPYCHTVREFTENVMEVIGYKVEYLNNCRPQLEREAEGQPSLED